MEITQSVLVAIMFVMILSIGIASLLMGMAGFISRRSEFQRYSIHTSWMILVLLIYFDLFWQTIALFSIEDWMFHDFLYVIAGPVILVFASSLLMPEFLGEGLIDLREHYFSVNRQFFFLLALTQIWAFGTDFVLRKGFTQAGVVDLLLMCLFIVLAVSRDSKLHGLLSSAVWLLFVVSVAIRGLGMIA